MYTAAAVHGHYSRPVPIIDQLVTAVRLDNSLDPSESVHNTTDQIAVHQYYRSPLMGQDQ